MVRGGPQVPWRCRSLIKLPDPWGYFAKCRASSRAIRKVPPTSRAGAGRRKPSSCPPPPGLVRCPGGGRCLSLPSEVLPPGAVWGMTRRRFPMPTHEGPALLPLAGLSQPQPISTQDSSALRVPGSLLAGAGEGVSRVGCPEPALQGPLVHEVGAGVRG